MKRTIKSYELNEVLKLYLESSTLLKLMKELSIIILHLIFFLSILYFCYILYDHSSIFLMISNINNI